MFLHKNDMCPRGSWVGNCIELVCGRLFNYINYQSSKSGREHTHEVICLKSCSPAVFVWQGDIPTLQEFIARGKGGGWMHTMLGKHKNTHAETVTYSLIYMHSIVHHKLVIMVITIIAIVVINHPDPWNFLAPSCFSRHRARLFSGRLSSGRLCDMNGHSIFWPLGWLDWLDWGHIPTIIQGLTRCNQSVD